MLAYGDRVRLTSGPRAGSQGVVTSVLSDRGEVFYQVTIASRTAGPGDVILCREDELEPAEGAR